jgi:glycosyltransferase involved in cell wall biosynthesis
MKVGIDISALNSMSKGRGIGFYSDYLIKSLKQYTNVEVIVIDGRQLIADSRQLDLIHYPFFDFFKPTLKVDPDIPTVVTIHDVIPLLFPKHYPSGIKGRINLFRQKQALKKVKAIITDSETSTRDVKKVFSINQDRIFSVYLDCADDFKNIKEKKSVTATLVRYHLPTRYLLYTGSVNWNKNLLNQTKAALAQGIDIVYIGKGFEQKDQLDHPEMASFKQFLEKYANNSRVHVLGFVPHEDLINLISGAQAILYVSFYEGFGLPILEAQSCGTPVITANTSSMVEVAGKAAILVDPDDEKAIEQAIYKIVNQPKIADELRQKGIANLERFSWEKTAHETVKVYKYALSKS